MANEEQLEILKAGASAWNEWRQENPLTVVDFKGANLIDAGLSAPLYSSNGGFDLSNADLTGADLSGASLWRANLNRARLKHTNLCRAMLVEVRFGDADLTESDLSGATLHHGGL